MKQYIKQKIKPLPARILGETWSSSTDARKVNFFLFGVKSVNYDINCTLFREVQTYIIHPLGVRCHV